MRKIITSAFVVLLASPSMACDEAFVSDNGLSAIFRDEVALQTPAGPEVCDFEWFEANKLATLYCYDADTRTTQALDAEFSNPAPDGSPQQMLFDGITYRRACT